MEVINKLDDDTVKSIDEIKNRSAREKIAKAQPYVARNLADMYNADLIQAQMAIEHWFNIYARIKGIVNADICSKIVDGKFMGNEVKIKRFKGNMFKAAKIINNG